MKLLSGITALLAAGAVIAAPVTASAQSWTTWNSATTTFNGTLNGSSVTFTGNFDGGSQLSGTGTNYFSPPNAYTQNGLSAPDNTGFVKFIDPVTGSLTFGNPILNPLVAMISVGAPGTPVTFTFDNPFTVESNNNSPNCAYWGCGTYTLSSGGGFYSITGREFSGTLEFSGLLSALSVTTGQTEDWYGLTVGEADVSVVPEPGTLSLLATGLVSLAAVGRRRKRSA